MVQIVLDRITIDPALQPRVEGLELEHVQALQEAPATWPPIVVVQRDDQYIVVDGCHRLEAARQLGLAEVACEVQTEPEGSDLKAVAFALNREHGKPLTLADCKAEAERLLRAEGSQLSNVIIAKRCRLSDKTIGKIRSELEATSDIPRLTHRTGTDGKVRSVTSGKANRTVVSQTASAAETPVSSPDRKSGRGTAAAARSAPSLAALLNIVSQMTTYADDHAMDDLAEALILAISGQRPHAEWSDIAEQLEFWGAALLGASTSLGARVTGKEDGR